jgi:cellulose synthase/poly-beta-1,6-N-acetylglucosamine synthase-like glycosyltransferase
MPSRPKEITIRITIKIRKTPTHLLQRHRGAEVTLFISHSTTVEADKFWFLDQFFDFLNLSGAGQHTQVSGMAMLMFTVFAFIDHNLVPFVGFITRVISFITKLFHPSHLNGSGGTFLHTLSKGPGLDDRAVHH